jgi:hypothetical protein
MQTRAKQVDIEYALSEEKRVSNAPCGCQVQNGGEEYQEFPAVDCDLECEKCGWNPAVRRARIERRLAQ